MSVYFIAEIGQNHNGEIGMAKELIDMAAQPIYHMGRRLPGVDAVKFQKRELKEEMTIEEAGREYGGQSYMEHRKALELSYAEHSELCAYAHEKGLHFIETVCSPLALELILEEFSPDKIKVASRDLDNVPLLRAIGRTFIPAILSTGMGTWADALQAAEEVGESVWALLHCVSTYPAAYADLNLRCMSEAPIAYRVGYSDHTTGILAPALAVAIGATVIEKHITLDPSLKGSDHAGSLAPGGLGRCVRDVRNAEIARGKGQKKSVPTSTQTAQNKLRRSVCAAHDIKAGEVIKDADIVMLSPGHGLSWYHRQAVVGKFAARKIEKHHMIGAADVRSTRR